MISMNMLTARLYGAAQMCGQSLAISAWGLCARDTFGEYFLQPAFQSLLLAGGYGSWRKQLVVLLLTSSAGNMCARYWRRRVTFVGRDNHASLFPARSAHRGVENTLSPNCSARYSEGAKHPLQARKALHPRRRAAYYVCCRVVRREIEQGRALSIWFDRCRLARAARAEERCDRFGWRSAYAPKRMRSFSKFIDQAVRICCCARPALARC